MDKTQATKLLLNTLEKGSVVKACIDYNEHFLFIAHRPDPLEGQLDPFFSVNKKTNFVRDFSPQDYPEPLVIIKLLQGSFKEYNLRS